MIPWRNFGPTGVGSTPRCHSGQVLPVAPAHILVDRDRRVCSAARAGRGCRVCRDRVENARLVVRSIGRDFVVRRATARHLDHQNPTVKPDLQRPDAGGDVALRIESDACRS
jgi:hypothetical protein